MMNIRTVERANANPSKTFFITMLTRDIDLADCILDLLDNAVDGITETARRDGVDLPADLPFAGKKVNLTLSRDHFEISDESGGIPIDIARDYAFRFGRPDEAPSANDGTIGLYGIGMKRALFKIGKSVDMISSTGVESFALRLDVEAWQRDPQTKKTEDGTLVPDWSFELEDIVRVDTDVPAGTMINITDLHEGVWRQFDNPIFVQSVHKIISRDYAFIIARGLEVYLNDRKVEPLMPTFKENEDLAPFRHVEVDDGVTIEITAGLASPPPNDVSANGKRPQSDTYGWYIVCNDRVVVTADKSNDTVWGRKPVPTWHPQFDGFMGVARFQSDDPKKLPWKTTKRDVEASNPFYLKALPIMIRATKHLVDYTNARRAEAKRLSKIEKAAPAKPVMHFKGNSPMKLPATSARDVIAIEYVREGEDVRAVSEALGIPNASPSEIGIKTFEYYLTREVPR